MVQFLSIIFFLGFLQFLLGFSKSSRFFVSLCTFTVPVRIFTRNKWATSKAMARVHQMSPLEYTKATLIDSYPHDFFLTMTQQPPSGPRPPHYRRFAITLRHTTICRIPLDEWSARRREFYPTTHNIHNRQTSMHRMGFEPAIPAS